MKNILIMFSFLLFLTCKNNNNVEPVNVNVQDEDTLKTAEIKVDSMAVKSEIAEPTKSYKALKAELKAKGFETFDYVDEKTKDTVLMQQYFMAFLKSGTVRNQNEEEAQQLQKEHLAHLRKMYDLGYADISGPFGDDGAIRGITIYNVPTLKMADSLANADPMVKAGRLVIEIHPWWAAKGFKLR
ncbi:YciI family protein [Formosa haliotis]|uniref:YciI family protein n=1 Tax=Formosa haliotis TaxID=1555194 RepID=UPI0008243710|nr:YciI family protein [Formosa haliotis]